MRLTTSAAVLMAAALASCATAPKDIAATYVSPLNYDNLDCNQIGAEAQRVSTRLAEATGQQERRASNDAVSMGVALVVFWPALFFIKGDRGNAAELARLKGEADAVQQAAVAKSCAIEFQAGPPAPPPPPPPLINGEAPPQPKPPAPPPPAQ